jgi:hypothetical protein
MSNPFSRLFSRTPPAAPADPPPGPADDSENAALLRLRAQMDDLKAASQALAAGNPSEFLAKLPHLKRLEVLNAQGQSFAHEFLLEAAGQGSVGVLQALLARGVAVSGSGLIRHNSGPGDTALHVAAGRGQVEVARFLVTQGADINAMNGWGETPLHCAVAHRHLGMMALLLELGADINARQTSADLGTPLWRATEKLLLDEVKFLLEHGADPRLTNPAKKLSPAEGAHRAFEETCRQFHQTHGEARAQLAERIKQYETLVQLLEAATRRLGPEPGKAAAN